MKYLQLLSTIALLPLILTFCKTPTPNEWSLSSPSNNIKVTISLNDLKSLQYEIQSGSEGIGARLIESSPLGIERDDASFNTGLTFVKSADIVSFTESYTMTSGKKASYENSGNELTLTFSNATGDSLNMIFRAFDNGVAYRYHFPEVDAKVHTIINDLSGFAIPPDSKAWIQPYDTVFKYAPGYERPFENGAALGTEARYHNGWCFPALFQIGSKWILLSEADIDRSHFGSHLNNEIDSNLYTIRLPEENEAISTGDNKAKTTLPWKSPWRVISIGDGLGDIVESSIITDLSRPASFDDTSWIRPGKSSWSWWSDASSSKDFKKLKKFIDLAAEMGWEYSLVDANWNVMEGGNIESLIDYANQKGVGILMWYNSGGPHNIVEEQPRDIMIDPVLRKAEFKKLQEWGVKGVKVDFFQSDKQHIIQQYIDIMEDASTYRIMTNFHGCTIPRGWRRTYPNLMSMESVRGGECYQFDASYPAIAPRQNTILPFTRNAIGPMDYTPITFSDNLSPHLTSNPHEAALGIVFESGILHLADAVESYQNVPDQVKDYLRDLPVSWDETRFVSGFPGKEVVIARRKGDRWYIGGINGENVEKTFVLSDLNFLGNGNYKAQLIQDAQTSHDFSFDETTLSASESISLKALPFGGFVAILKPL